MNQNRRALIAYALGSMAGAIAGRPRIALAQRDDPQSIIKKADLVRFPTDGFEVEVTIRSFRDEKLTDSHKYKVLSKGNDSSLVMTLEPATESGQILLMKGRDLWIFMPDVTQPVRLSLAQRLTGQVANGDIARANFSGDYTPTLVRTEKTEQDTLQVLELKAVDRGVTYHRVMYWVRQSNAWPQKAEFYSLSGRLLKVCTYEGFRELGGAVRPTRLVMQDALKPAERSVMEYAQLKARDLPDKIFTKDYLKKLQ
jgi:outer membrane lipoprotein-sorting protein